MGYLLLVAAICGPITQSPSARACYSAMFTCINKKVAQGTPVEPAAAQCSLEVTY